MSTAGLPSKLLTSMNPAGSRFQQAKRLVHSHYRRMIITEFQFLTENQQQEFLLLFERYGRELDPNIRLHDAMHNGLGDANFGMYKDTKIFKIALQVPGHQLGYTVDLLQQADWTNKGIVVPK